MPKQTPKKLVRTIEEAEALGLTEIEIDVSDDVYNKLNENKREDESWSDVIRRMLAMTDALPQGA